MILINSISKCPCCIEAEHILNIYNIPYKKNLVRISEKNKYKKDFKYDTFPQIYFIKNKRGTLIGGLSEFKQLLLICNIIKKYKYTSELITFLKRFSSDC